MKPDQICKFLRNEPLYDSYSTDHVDIQNLQSFSILSNAIKKAEQSPLFLIGPWGSGKTVMLRELKNRNKSTHVFIEYNYFGIRTVDEALSHLIGIGWRMVLFIFMFAIVSGLYWLTQHYLILGGDLEKPFLETLELKGLAGVTIIFLFSFVIRPRSRLLFLGSLIFQISYYHVRSLLKKRRTIVIIEDLDRSSLSLADKFSFLSQLPPLPVRYVIAYGHNSDTEYITLIEYINKLNGISVELKQDQKVAFEILKKYISYLPFSQASNWMSELSIRELLGFYYAVERKTFGKSEFEKKLELVLSYFDTIRTKKIKYTSGRDSSDINITFNGGKFKSENSSISFTRHEGEILNSYFSSIDIEYFRNYLDASVDQNDKNAASNWIEVAWRKIVSDPVYREQIASKVK